MPGPLLSIGDRVVDWGSQIINRELVHNFNGKCDLWRKIKAEEGEDVCSIRLGGQGCFAKQNRRRLGRDEHESIVRKNILGRGMSRYKGPGARIGLACLKNRQRGKGLEPSQQETGSQRWSPE